MNEFNSAPLDPPGQPQKLGRLLICVVALGLIAVIAPRGSLQAQMLLPVVPVVYDYDVVERVAQPRQNFVQGLQIVGDTLYVSTGMYGESRLREYAFPSMELRRERSLPDSVFGEGVTRLNDKLYQLTWRAGRMLEYDASTMKLLRSHVIPTEGWGITDNNSDLIYSDGTPQLYFLDPNTLQRRRTLNVTLNGTPLPRLNELEWIDGEIWANVFQANQLVRINPTSGFVTAVIDLRGLLAPEDYADDTDVLNGIAWDAAESALWVTGKRWPWIFRVRLKERSASPSATQ
ncbi:MAG: glutaminyl-peptide cyclotransferase [Congregibacter sp.]